MKKIIKITLVAVAIAIGGTVTAQALENRTLLVLNAQKKDIEDSIAFIRQEIDAINYGWFGFGLSKETKEKYHKAKALRKNLEKKLTGINAKISVLKTNNEKGTYL